jgi:hypothetical protein
MSTAFASSQNVSLPEIPELYNPNFLDALIPPVEPRSVSKLKEASGQSNRMIDALQATTNQTFTENLAPTYSSTGSPTLDAFQLLHGRDSGPQFNSYLENAWHEDSDLTLRIIWNIRSIHDGRGDKGLFYRYVFHAYP